MPEYNAQTLRALDDSIAHWKRLSTNSQIGDECPDASNCALCKRHLHEGCVDCPIFDATGRDTCRGTPYRYAAVTWDWENEKPRDEFFTHALDMLNFLIALRKEIHQ